MWLEMAESRWTLASLWRLPGRSEQLKRIAGSVTWTRPVPPLAVSGKETSALSGLSRHRSGASVGAAVRRAALRRWHGCQMLA